MMIKPAMRSWLTEMQISRIMKCFFAVMMTLPSRKSIIRFAAVFHFDIRFEAAVCRLATARPNNKEALEYDAIGFAIQVITI